LHLDAVRRLAPDHPLVLEESRAIDRASRPPATEVATKSSAGSEAAPKPPEPSAHAEREEKLDSHELVRRGERALEDGSVRAAQRLFEQALTQSPGLGSALIGLGYVALERSQTRIALLRFKPAARAGHAEAWIGLGDTYRRVGRMRDALDAYKTYLSRFPKGPRKSIAERQIQLLNEQLAAGASP
jgi:tetratricopeptide (TPR) repeat protein